MGENTGKLVYPKLKKVVNGGERDGQALDSTNKLCSVTQNPQDKKNNITSDPDYKPPIVDYDSCPLNDFTLNPVDNAELSTEYESNTITVKGISGTAPLGVIGSGFFSKNGAPYTNASTTCTSGDTVKVKGTSSDQFSTLVDVTLKVGNTIRKFNITTKSEPTP